MSITIRVKMNQNVQAAMKRCQAASLKHSGEEIERAMKITLSSPGGANHTPSMPGMPPNRQHGELRSSVHSDLRGDGEAVIAGATAPYARIQEKGGVTHPTVTPRMRKWAWAMYYKFGKKWFGGRRGTMKRMRGSLNRQQIAGSEGGKYLALALTKKDKLTVTLPPRPFVQRSLTAALPGIMHHWKGMLHK